MPSWDPHVRDGRCRSNTRPAFHDATQWHGRCVRSRCRFAPVKLATWNINSIRAREGSGSSRGSAKRNPMSCACRRPRSRTPGFPSDALRRPATTSRCSGRAVTTASRSRRRAPITDVTRGFGDDERRRRSRVIAATVDGIRVIDVYVPNGQELDVRQVSVQARVVRRLRAYLDRTATPATPLVAVRRLQRHRRRSRRVVARAVGRQDPLQRRRSATRSPRSLAFGLVDRVPRAQPRRQDLLVVGLPRRLVLQEPGPAHRLHLRDRAGRGALHRRARSIATRARARTRPITHR